MNNVIENSDSYSKKSGPLQKYCRDKPVLNNNGVIGAVDAANITDSCNFKVKTTGQNDDNRSKNVEIMVPLKYVNNFLRTLEIPLINCEINLVLTWSANCVQFLLLLQVKVHHFQ